MESPTYKPLDLRIVFSAYGALALVAMIWDWLSRGDPLWIWQESALPSLWAVGGGALFVGGYIVLSLLMRHIGQWVSELEQLFQRLLTPLSYFQIFVLGIASGFVEEWFFRGILMTHFGIFISSILFGLCHFIPAPRLWIWSVWAMGFGLLFAWIFHTTHSLLLCSLIHSAINIILIIMLNQIAINGLRFASENVF